MIAATPSEQRELLALQELDTAVRQLEHRRANLPEQKALDEQEETARKVADELHAAEEELADLERRGRRLEDEVAQVDSRRKAEEGRMYSGLITSEKEVGAIKGELASLRQRKSELEDTQLEVMERSEELTTLVATLRQRSEELTTDIERLVAERDEAARGIDAELTERRAERERAASGIADEVRAFYEDLRARKGGVAVAALEGRTCAGCRLELTAIELEETKERARSGLARCAQCDRILVVG